MASGIPILYAQPESLSVPYSVLGDDLKSFKGAKNSVRSVPSSSGTAGPSSTALFNLPVGGYSFIKSNSMYLRGMCEVTTSDKCFWGFAGQGADTTNEKENFGGASSLINRISVNLGGTQLSYGAYNGFRNSVLPHVCSAEYFSTDLRQCEHAGVWRDASGATDAASRRVYFAIPLWLPPFCSSQHFPALLMNSPIAIEILTETVGKALYSEVAGGSTGEITNYSLSNLSLVYETIDVSREFKDAMLASKAGGFYSIHMNDYLAVGPNSATASMRTQIGVGFSSLKSILFTETASNPGVKDRKVYTSNGLTNYVIHADNFPVSVANAGENEAVCFLEVNRALQKINDSNVTSSIFPQPNVASSGVRTSYATNNFLAGASTQTISDYNYSSSGIECSSVVLELEHGSPDNDKWGAAPDFSTANSVIVYLLHDSIMSVNVSDGTVQVRK